MRQAVATPSAPRTDAELYSRPSSATVNRDCLRASIERQRQAAEKRRLIESEAALRAIAEAPARPTRPMLGGWVSYAGRVKGLDLADLIQRPVAEAVRDEMVRQGIADLCGCRFEEELIETATASLLATNEPPFDARTYDEAAMLVVAHAIDTGEHKAERIKRMVDGAEGWPWV